MVWRLMLQDNDPSWWPAGCFYPGFSAQERVKSCCRSWKALVGGNRPNTGPCSQPQVATQTMKELLVLSLLIARSSDQNVCGWRCMGPQCMGLFTSLTNKWCFAREKKIEDRLPAWYKLKYGWSCPLSFLFYYSTRCLQPTLCAFLYHQINTNSASLSEKEMGRFQSTVGRNWFSTVCLGEWCCFAHWLICAICCSAMWPVLGQRVRESFCFPM